MTLEAKLATEIAYRMEVKKDALRQTQDNGVKVTFSIHPQDVHPALYSDPMGQRYVMVIVPLSANDETPRVDTASPSSDKAVTGEAGGSGSQPKSPRKWDELPYSQRAAIRCSEPVFQEFVADRMGWMEPDTKPSEELATNWLRGTCGVESRKQILPNFASGRAFEEVEREYDTWLKYERGR